VGLTGLLLASRRIALPTAGLMSAAAVPEAVQERVTVVEMVVRLARRGRRFLAAVVLEGTRALAGRGHGRQPAQTGQAAVVVAVLEETQVLTLEVQVEAVLDYLVKDQAGLVAQVHRLAALVDQVGPLAHRLLATALAVPAAYLGVVVEHRKEPFQHPVALALPVGCV
jgi:hypothetical protein